MDHEYIVCKLDTNEADASDSFFQIFIIIIYSSLWYMQTNVKPMGACTRTNGYTQPTTLKKKTNQKNMRNEIN